MLRRVSLLLASCLLATVLLLAACGRDATAPESSSLVALSPLAAADGPFNLLDGINLELHRRGAGVAIARAECLTLAEGATAVGAGFEAERVLFASDHFLRLPYRWVPGDERRLADGDRLTYLVDQSEGEANPGIPPALTEAAIDAAMGTWDTARTCSSLEIVKRPDTGADPDIIDFFLGQGGFGDPFVADIVNAGFLPAAFFDALGPGGSEYILAVTFTLVFTDDQDRPTDINGDQRLDTALKEVYYNNRFAWSVGATRGIDIQTVALHENGHALELGHYGNLFLTAKNGKLHAAPRAVMNAVYLGPFRDLTTADQGAFCSVYGSWPNR